MQQRCLWQLRLAPGSSLGQLLLICWLGSRVKRVSMLCKFLAATTVVLCVKIVKFRGLHKNMLQTKAALLAWLNPSIIRGSLKIRYLNKPACSELNPVQSRRSELRTPSTRCPFTLRGAERPEAGSILCLASNSGYVTWAQSGQIH